VQEQRREDTREPKPPELPRAESLDEPSRRTCATSRDVDYCFVLLHSITSIRMANTNSRTSGTTLTTELSKLLGSRRTARLRRVMRETGLPPEILLDVAIELLDIASRGLSPSPIRRTAIGLGAARWRNVSPEDRSEALRRAAQARWAKHRPAPVPADKPKDR
jgi:hypothetical protein